MEEEIKLWGVELGPTPLRGGGRVAGAGDRADAEGSPGAVDDTAARGRPGAGDDSAAEGAPAAEAELRTQDAAAARLCAGRMRAADSRAAGRQGPGSALASALVSVPTPGLTRPQTLARWRGGGAGQPGGTAGQTPRGSLGFAYKRR